MKNLDPTNSIYPTSAKRTENVLEPAPNGLLNENRYVASCGGFQNFPPSSVGSATRHTLVQYRN